MQQAMAFDRFYRLNGVFDEIEHDLQQLNAIGKNAWDGFIQRGPYGNLVMFQFVLDKRQDFLNKLVQINRRTQKTAFAGNCSNAVDDLARDQTGADDVF